MSYSNYPAGAEHDPSAPWNDVEVPEVTMLADVTYSVTISLPVCTDNYSGNFYDEEGYREPAHYEGSSLDAQKELESQYYGFESILDDCIDLLREKIVQIWLDYKGRFTYAQKCLIAEIQRKIALLGGISCINLEDASMTE